MLIMDKRNGTKSRTHQMQHSSVKVTTKQNKPFLISPRFDKLYFFCLQHLSGALWREWQIHGCILLVYVPEASLSSADKKLEGNMQHLSVFVCFPHCILHIRSPVFFFDSLMPIFDVRDVPLVWRYTQKRMYLRQRCVSVTPMLSFFLHAEIYSVLLHKKRIYKMNLIYFLT